MGRGARAAGSASSARRDGGRPAGSTASSKRRSKERRAQLGKLGTSLHKWDDAGDEAEVTHKVLQAVKEDQEIAEDQVPQVNRAVSLEFLLRFAEYIKENVASEKALRRLQTCDVVHGIDVNPIKDGNGFRYSSDAKPYSIRGLTKDKGSNMCDFFKDEAASASLRRDLQQMRSEELSTIADAHKAASKKKVGAALTLEPRDAADPDACEGALSDEDGDDGACAAPDGDACVQGENLIVNAPKRAETGWFGRADFFVSHAWKLRFFDLVEALKDPRTTGSETFEEHCSKYFWIDIFAVNQHYVDNAEETERIKKERDEDLANFEKVIEFSKKGMVMVMYPWNKPELLGRAWCWFEIATALKYKKEIRLALTRDHARKLKSVAEAFTKEEEERSIQENDGVKAVTEMLRDITLEKSECLLDSDREFIMDSIEKGEGAKVVNQRVTLAIAGLLMTTADQLLKSYKAKGTTALYEAMLEHFAAPAVRREKALALNKLTRVYLIMGRKDRAIKYCKDAIDLQDELLKELPSGSSSTKEERALILKEKAMNLSSLGRTYCDMHEPACIETALEHLRPAEKILRDLKDPALSRELAEVLYNLGRTFVLHHERFPGAASPRDAKRDEDLERAQDNLQESMDLQEKIQKESGQDLASLGALYVFMGKVLDLKGDDADEALEFFAKGEEQQMTCYGRQDPRVYMTRLDTGRHHMNRDDYVEAWELFMDAHNGLKMGAQLLGADPVKMLECEVEMARLLALVDSEQVRGELTDWEELVPMALQALDWLENNRPHLSDNPDVVRLADEIRDFAVDTFGSKLQLALHRLEVGGVGPQAHEDDLGSVAYAKSMEERVKSDIPAFRKRGPVGTAVRAKMEDALGALPAGIADVIVSDAPYNRGVDTAWDELGHADFLRRIRRWSRLMVRALAPDGVGFVFSDATYASYWMHELRTARGAAPLNESSTDPAPAVVVESAVWYKPDAAWRKAWVEEHADQAVDFATSFKEAKQVVRDCLEVVIIFRRDGDAGLTFKEAVTTALGPDAANVWRLEKCKAPERLSKESGFWHPAQKPLSLMRPLVKIAIDAAQRRAEQRVSRGERKVSLADAVSRDALVLEPFMGTGGGVVAAMQLGIPSLGCDLDEKWIRAVEMRVRDEATTQGASSNTSGTLSRRLGSLRRYVSTKLW